MNKFKILFLLIFLIVLSSCSAKYADDADYLSENELIEYVEERIFGNILLVSKPDEKKGDSHDYTFYIESRDIYFKVSQIIRVPYAGLDGAQLWRTGDSYLDINTNYFDVIFEHYKEDREKLAKEINIDSDDFQSVYIENYDDIEKAAEFIIELDKLYAYESSLEARDWQLYVRIYFNEFKYSESTTFWIEPVPLSTDRKERLKYDDVYEQIVREYILQLKRCNLSDAAIPEDVYNIYEEILDE